MPPADNPKLGDGRREEGEAWVHETPPSRERSPGRSAGRCSLLPPIGPGKQSSNESGLHAVRTSVNVRDTALALDPNAGNLAASTSMDRWLSL